MSSILFYTLCIIGGMLLALSTIIKSSSAWKPTTLILGIWIIALLTMSIHVKNNHQNPIEQGDQSEYR